MRRGLGLLLLLLFPVLARAAWLDVTRRVEGPRTDRGGALVLVPGQPLKYRTSRRVSLKWVLDVVRPGSLFVVRGRDTLQRLRLTTGRHVKRFALEPGAWMWVGTLEGKARVYRWKVRRWKSLTPVGGGFPVVLKHRSGKKYTYSIVRAGQSLQYHLKGPNRAHILLRLPLARGQRRARAVVDILRDGRLLQRVALDLSRSRAVVINDGGAPVTRAREVVVRVGRGRHTLEVRAVHGRVLVKAYREKKKSRRKRTGARMNLRWWGRVGITYDANPFRFSPEARDTFTLGTAPWRYPGVVGLTDERFTLQAGVTLRRGRAWRVSGHIRLMAYLRNRDLFRYALSLAARRRWMEGGLVWVPRYPVRPTYAGPRTYVLLEQRVVRIWAGIREKGWGVRLEGGLYRFNAPFDRLNAVFAGAEIPLSRGPFALAFRVRRVMDPDTAGGDFSHWRWGGRGAVRWKVSPALDIRLSGLLERYDYTAAAGDSRNGRKDIVLEMRVEPGVLLTPSLEFRFPAGVRMRSTSSPSPYLDVFKDYATWWLGVDLRLRMA